MRRLLAPLLSSLMLLSLAGGAALASPGNGGGGDSGNKYGNWHKNDTIACPDGYELQYWGGPYDLNENGYVCAKWVDDGYAIKDDISNWHSDK